MFFDIFNIKYNRYLLIEVYLTTDPEIFEELKGREINLSIK